MIDTIRFKITDIYPIYEKIRAKSEEVFVLNNSTKEPTGRFVKKSLKLGSYDYHINFRIDDPNTMFVEFSLPKYWYGHNIYEISPEAVIECLGKIQSQIEEYFQTPFPRYNLWVIQRIDLCRVWKLGKGRASRILSIIKDLEYARKKPVIWNTSVYFNGTTTIKFYLKHEEFIKNDYKRIKEFKGGEIADQLLEESKDVLRFEATIRIKYIKRLFGLSNEPYIQDILNKDLLNLKINELISGLFRYSTCKLNNITEIEEILLKKYKPSMVVKLISFQQMYYSSNRTKKRIIKDNTSKTTIWRYKCLLRDAGVGIFTNTRSGNSYARGSEHEFFTKTIWNGEPPEWLSREAKPTLTEESPLS